MLGSFFSFVLYFVYGQMDGLQHLMRPPREGRVKTNKTEISTVFCLIIRNLLQMIIRYGTMR